MLASKRRIGTRGFFLVNSIEPGSDRLGPALAEIGRQGVRIELAARQPELSRQILAGLENIVRDNYRDFHEVLVSPWADSSNFEGRSTMIEPSCWMTADRFNVVPVRIENKRRVVVLGVPRSQPGRAVVCRAHAEGRLMKRVDCISRAGQKGDMQRATYSATCPDPERRIGRHTETSQPSTVIALDLHHDADAQRREGFEVERAAALEVCDSEIDVMNHGHRQNKIRLNELSGRTAGAG